MPVTPPDQAQIQHTASIAATAGGVLWAMATVFTIIFAPTPPDRRTTLKALVEAAFSIIAAVIGGWFVAPSICLYFKVTQIETVSMIGLGVGLSFWNLVPLLNTLIIKITLARLGQLGNKP